MDNMNNNMHIVQKIQKIIQIRIQDWIEQGDENKVLDLSRLDLAELPDNIPENIFYSIIIQILIFLHN